MASSSYGRRELYHEGRAAKSTKIAAQGHEDSGPRTFAAAANPRDDPIVQMLRPESQPD
jgi:hypothetical protein